MNSSMGIVLESARPHPALAPANSSDVRELLTRKDLHHPFARMVRPFRVFVIKDTTPARRCGNRWPLSSNALNRARGRALRADSFFHSQCVQLAMLAARHAIPGAYSARQYAMPVG